ncbi:MAG TPA: TraB/GumN family protein [Caulobacteraceae bacterium]
MIRGAIVAALLVAWAGRATAKPPVWTVTSNVATVVLFGSVHLLPPGLDWRPAALNLAISKADVIYFELPIDEATDAEASRLAMVRGRLPATDSLSAHLPPGEEARLHQVATILGARLESIETMRPWLAEMTLSVLADVRQGAEAAQGVERQVQNLAPTSAVRKAFESASEQIDTLAGAPEADQIASLDETLGEILEHPDTYRRVIAEWLEGDLRALGTDALAPLEKASPGAYRRLITDRNRRWTVVIRRLLAHPGATLIVVGMGHLIGPGGVPALLRAEGFHVSGP